MKLSEYAKKNSISYGTAYRHFKTGLVKGKQLPTGTIVIENEVLESDFRQGKVALYARVSSSENKTNLDTQMERLKSFAASKGFTVVHEIKEIGSGLNDNRKKLLSLIGKDDYSVIIVEHKDRFSRFGTKIIEILLEKTGKQLLVINETGNDTNDLMQDFVSIVTSFTARLYGLRRSKRKTEKIIQELNSEVD